MARKKDCIEYAALGGIQGILIGIPLGGGLGFTFGGPVGAAIGAFAGFVGGWLIGLGVGYLICWFVDWLGSNDDPPFKMPKVTEARLQANPNPVAAGATCMIGLFFKIDGNDDRLLMKVTYELHAEGASPEDSPPQPPHQSNASFYQRWINPPFSTSWNTPHDGREVSGKLFVDVTDGKHTRQIVHDITPITVGVHQ